MRLPASITAAGKAMLSHMNEFDVRQLFTAVADDNTIDALIQTLSEEKARGYSFDNEDVSEGLVCYGAPVLDSKNKPIAGIAVSLLKEDATPEKGKQIVDNLTDIAVKLSMRMGADV